MVSKMCRIASMIVLATFAFSSAAWAATCSNASLSGTTGFCTTAQIATALSSSAENSQLRRLRFALICADPFHPPGRHPRRQQPH
jgi:hypothetical protein